MRQKQHAERGSIIVETALTIGVGLTIILFTIQLGILGFLQITADSAAFIDAHYYAVGTPTIYGTAAPEQVVNAFFPQVRPSDITTTPMPAPTIVLPLDYGYNGTANEQQAKGTRHAGVSMIQPIIMKSTVHPHGMVSVLGQMLGVSGDSFEPMQKECGPHFNVQQQNIQCGTTGQPAGYEVDPIPSPGAAVASGGENTPPYYASFNFKLKCVQAQPWTACTNATGANSSFYAFGVAEFLDASNWGAANPAASGNGKTNGVPTSTFEYMLCHQQAYSTLDHFLSQYASIGAINTAFSKSLLANVKTAAPTNFGSWNEFDSTDNAIVQQIYSWDANVPYNQALNPATEPGGTSSLVLHADAGC